MKLKIKVVPRAKRPGVERVSDGTWRVAVSAPAEGGRANAAVIEAIAEYFDLPKGAVRITRGFTGRRKEVEVSSFRC